MSNTINNSENGTPLFSDIKQGVILLPTEKGLTAFKLVMSNPEQINADDLSAGEPQLIMTTKGQIETYAGVVPPVKFQSSMWRKSRSQMVVAIFTDKIFANEAFYPIHENGSVNFSLYHQGAGLDGVLHASGRSISRFGEEIPEGTIPNLECMLVNKDFNVDGFLSLITYETQNGLDLDFGNGSDSISVSTRTMGVKLGDIPTLSRIPIHNMHGDGRWCISASSLVSCRMYPSMMHPGPLFEDLRSSPANSDLDWEAHAFMRGIPIMHSDPTKAPIMRIVPTKDYTPYNFALTLPPIWPKIRKF